MFNRICRKAECRKCGAGSRQHYFCGDDARDYAASAWNTRTHGAGEAVEPIGYFCFTSNDRKDIGQVHPMHKDDHDVFPLYTYPPRAKADEADGVVKVTLGRELFRFDSFQQWVNKAQSWFKSAGVSSTQFVCIDSTGRICGMGKQFMSARDRGAFPIVVYHIEPESDAAMAEAAEGGV